MTTVVLVQQGGTGSNNASDARSALGAAPTAAYDQANAAFAAANSGSSSAGAAYNQANAAYTQANTARSDANTTFATVNTTFGTVNTSVSTANTQANSGRDQANAAYGQANTSYGQANSARDQANTARDTANSAYGQANLAYTQANSAFTAANNSNLKSGGIISGTLNVTNDIIVGGNVYLQGNTTFINVSTYQVNDPLMYIAANNILTDSVDIGFVGAKNTSGTFSHTGLARDATDGKYKLFDNLPDSGHVGNVIDFANSTIATLVTNVEANTLTLGGNTVATQANLTLAHNQANNAYGQANLAYTAANNAVLKAGDTMTGQLTVSVATSTDAVRITQTGSGNALVVEDSANPDTSPFVVDAGGQLIQGYTTAINNWNGAPDSFAVHSSASNARPSKGLYNWSTNTARVGTFAMYKSVSGNVGSYGAIGASQQFGRIAFCGDDGTSFIRGAEIFASVDGTVGANSMPGRLQFLTTAAGASSPTERMRIDANGNIGIGISSPSKRLHITGSAIISDGATPANNATLLVQDDGVANTVTSSATFRVTNDGTSPTFAVFEASSGVSNTVITNAGNMGIGTTTPSYKLDVTGAIRATANVLVGTGAGTQGGDDNLIRPTSTNAFLNIKGGVGRAKIVLGNDGLVLSSGTTDQISFHTNAAANTIGTERMRITNTGSVGIGTTNPGMPLEVFTGNSTLGIRIKRFAGNYYSDIVHTDTPEGLAFNVGDGTTVTEKMRITGAGNIGIGTTSPGNSKLRLNHGSGFYGASYPIQTWAYANYQVVNLQHDGSVNPIFNTDADSQWGPTATMIWQYRGTEKMRLDTSGNVSITGTLTESSSIVLKENINPINNALDLMQRLVGVTYDRKDGSAKQRAGLIAEEVEKVLPNLVQKDNDGNAYGIHYTNLIAYLVESIKELNNKIERLESNQ